MKNSTYIAFGLFFFFLSSFSLEAQVNPPDLLCIKSDTLVWELPTNTCGIFNSYIIYGSTSAAGPYTIIATITDPTQTTFYHSDADNMTWHYYMTTDANCPGEPVLTSDTLNNQPPGISPLIYADIVDGKVLLEWTQSTSPEVIGYIIYRVTEIGTVPIDTVDALTYYDLGSNPDLQIENYYVIALDACGNTSLLAAPHRTVLVQGEIISCDQSIYLHWNLYEGWTGIDRQEVWLGTNGDPPTLLQTISGSDTSTTVLNLIDETDYCFFIKSYDAITGSSSTSNEICLTVDIIASIRDLALKNVSVTADNEVTVSWQWNADAELSDFSILSSIENSNYGVIETLTPPIPLLQNNIYTDVSAASSTSSVYYQVATTDLCDSTALSNYGATIYLSGQANNDLQNILSWTPFIIENAQVNYYEIYRVSSSGANAIGQVEPDEFTFFDPVNPRDESDAKVYYYIVAEATVPLAGGTEEIIYSRSNTACIVQPTSILAPNAFAPNGKNYEFRPLLRFGESANYQMTIWDRWGQKLFETNDVKNGWTGRKGYQEYPQGVYTYQIRVTQLDGKQVEKTGVVMLIW